ncbi:hypothetical protein K9M79_08500 [Candidatus Woesearchaeota archaeon]|nr:hypothetical protein [Candidatus Woesearchaeota archaeon]
MPSDPLPYHRIKYKGVFDYAGLQSTIRGWQTRRGWTVLETLYKRKPGNEVGKEEEIKFRSWRKESDFVMYWINIFIHTWDMQPVEVIENGQKKKLVKARMLIEVNGESQWDYNNMFAGNWFTPKLLKFYMRYLRGMGTDKEWDGIWGDRHYYYVLKLLADIKEFLGMETAQHDVYKTMW